MDVVATQVLKGKCLKGDCIVRVLDSNYSICYSAQALRSVLFSGLNFCLMDSSGEWVSGIIFLSRRKIGQVWGLVSTCLRPIPPYTENFLVSDCLSENGRHLNHISYFLPYDVTNKV